MSGTRPVISHIVIACFDFTAMVAFYTKTLGFAVSDIGKIRDTDLCFLTFDPEAEHHQVALTGGRKGAPGDGALVHVCFRLPDYAGLQARQTACPRQFGHCDCPTTKTGVRGRNGRPQAVHCRRG